jgi:chromosome segregation protein
MVERSGAIIGGFYIARKTFSDTDDIKSYYSRKEQTAKEIGTLEDEVIKLNKQLEQLTAQEQFGSKEIVEMQKERELIEQNYESMRAKRKRTFEERTNSQEEINKLRIKKARLEAELENLKLEFENYKKTETYQLAPSTLENKIRENVDKINSLGAINMKALEEYEQQKVVYDDLKEKVDKLTEERNKVVEIIADVEGQRKEIFMKTLDGIREQFKIVFNDLMKGEADLKLVGGLDSGLLIEASSRGKTLTNIDAMSGGEKTLTALAFLFSIQRFRPAPFYVLDEIDAALDRPNTKKVVELIKKYTPSSQFIVITHNESTIQEAGCVYGVSIEDGESNLVGIRMPS